MRLARRTNLLIEPPAAATGDIAFNLLVFFLVCASTQPDSGRRQNIPASEPKQQASEQSRNIEVYVTRTTAAIDGRPYRNLDQFQARLAQLLSAKPRPEDKVVVVRSSKDASYAHWIDVTGRIEAAGGTITLQLEEERTVVAP